MALNQRPRYSNIWEREDPQLVPSGEGEAGGVGGEAYLKMGPPYFSPVMHQRPFQ